MMKNNTFRNAVFTLLPPLDIPDPEFDQAAIPADDPDKNGEFILTKTNAVDGSFDKSYFIADDGHSFRFPDYNKDWKGLVQVKDATNYEELYFQDRDEEEISSYSFEDFEYDFWTPDWEIQSFKSFLGQLPEEKFDKGIRKKELLNLFERFDHFLDNILDEDEYFEIFDRKPETAIQLGLVVPVDPDTTEPEFLWRENVKLGQLETICKANRIEPAKTAKTMIKRLLENKVPFPYEGFEPTPLLKEWRSSFADMYIEEIRKNADHFHPLYFESLWKNACWQAENDEAEKKAREIIAEPSWKDRLVESRI